MLAFPTPCPSGASQILITSRHGWADTANLTVYENIWPQSSGTISDSGSAILILVSSTSTVNTRSLTEIAFAPNAAIPVWDTTTFQRITGAVSAASGANAQYQYAEIWAGKLSVDVPAGSAFRLTWNSTMLNVGVTVLGIQGYTGDVTSAHATGTDTSIASGNLGPVSLGIQSGGLGVALAVGEATASTWTPAPGTPLQGYYEVQYDAEAQDYHAERFYRFDDVSGNAASPTVNLKKNAANATAGAMAVATWSAG